MSKARRQRQRCMSPRRFKPDIDYPTFASWWTSRGLTPPAKNSLPPNGFTVDDVATVFVYLTDSPVAIVAWPTAHPKSSRRERREALEALLFHIETEVRDKGFTHVLGMTMHASLRDLFASQGYLAGDTGVTQYVKKVS